MNRQILLLFALLLIIGGCNDSAPGTASTEYLNVSDVDIPGGNTTATLSVQASQGCEWVISWNEQEVNWVRSVIPLNGRGSQNVTITVDVNPSSIDSRTANLTITNLNKSIVRTAKLTQYPNIEILELSENTHVFDYKGGKWSFTITTNASWEISGYVDGFSYAPQKGQGNSTITVEAQENTSENARTLNLSIVAGSKRETVKVEQTGAPKLSVSPHTINALPKEKQYPIEIICNMSWTASVNQGWMSLNQTSGEGDGTLMVKCEENTNHSVREGKVIVTVGTTLTKEIIVSQAYDASPSIVEVKVTDIGTNSAFVTAHYTSPTTVAQYGVCYSTSQNPNFYSDKVEFDGNSTDGVINAELKGLSTGTKYYVRAFAVNSDGIAYSEEVSFVTTIVRPDENGNPTPNLIVRKMK